MLKNDEILIIDDESPPSRAARKGGKVARGIPNAAAYKVGFLDKVDKVTGKKVKLKKSKDPEFEADSGDEIAAVRSQRASQGEPTRKAYIFPHSAFPTPRGMELTIESIDLDPRMIDVIKAYDTKIRAERGQ